MSCELRSLMALLGGLVAGNLLLMPAVAEDTRFAPMALASDEAPTPEPSRGLLSKLRLPFGNSSAPGAAQDTSANTRTTAMVDTNVMPAAYNARGQRGGQFRRTQGQRIGLLEQLTANQGQQTQRKTNNQPQPISSQTSSTRPGRQMPMPTYKQPQYHPNKLQLPEMNQISVAGVNQLPRAPRPGGPQPLTRTARPSPTRKRLGQAIATDAPAPASHATRTASPPRRPSALGPNPMVKTRPARASSMPQAPAALAAKAAPALGANQPGGSKELPQVIYGNRARIRQQPRSWPGKEPATPLAQAAEKTPETSATPSNQPLTPAQQHVRNLVIEIHREAGQAYTEDDFTHVIETCRRALAVEPEGETADYAKKLCAWSLNRRGQLKADARDEKLAMLDFEDAIRMDAGQWRAIHNRGVLRAQSGDFEKAFDDFNHCTELNPRFAKAYSNRAALFVQAGDLLAALQDYRRAIQLDPELAVAHKGRGRVCHMLGSTEEALRHFDAAVQLAPNDGHVVASRADLLTDMGRYAYAAAEYDRAIALDGRLEHAYRSSAWLLATCPDDSVRNAELAIEHAQRAIELERRENPISLDTLAAAQANSGKFEAAIETMHQVLEIAPDAEQEVYQARLANYELGKPFRVKPIAQIATVSYDE